MKKIYTILLGMSIMVMGVPANLNAQAVEEGNFIVDGYYGFGMFGKAFLRSAMESGTGSPNGNESLKFRAIGPVGLRFEYMVSEKMGVGLDGHFSNMTVSYKDDSSGYTYKGIISTVRVMPRLNFHLDVSDNFDSYFAVGAGYRKRTYKFESDEPGFNPGSLDGVIPFSLRFALGGRYFFTENIGLNMEFGLLGGALIHAGISAKF